MAENYLYEKITNKSFKPHVQQAAHDCITEALQVVQNDILRGLVQIKSRNKDIDEQFSQYIEEQSSLYTGKKSPHEEIEDNIRIAKLKEAQRMKKELKQKLVTVDENIKEIGSVKAIQNMQKVSLMDAGTRQAFFEQEKQKQKEAEAFAKQVAAKRQAALKKRNEDKHRKRMSEIEKKKQEQEIQEEEKATEEMVKKMRLEEMAEKRKERKQELQKQKKLVEDSGNVKSKSRLAQVDKKFKSHILMPELKRRKQQLMAKRELYAPLDHEDMEDHADWYAEQKRQLESRRKEALKKRSKSHMQNAYQPELNNYFQQKLAHDSATIRQQEVEKIESKHARIEAKERYSSMVKEIYKPSIDEKKRLELQLVIDKSHNPVKQPLFRSASTKNTVDSKSKTERRQFAPNPMLPPPKVARTSNVIDYLSQRRQLRENQSEVQLKPTLMNIDMQNENLTNLTARADQLEQRALRKELMLEKARLDNPNAIAAKGEVADALIGSVRAKLKLLNN